MEILYYYSNEARYKHFIDKISRRELVYLTSWGYSVHREKCARVCVCVCVILNLHET